MAANPQADQELKTCAISPQDNTNLLYVRVDGVNLDITKVPRATTSFYNVTVPSNAVTGLFDFGPPGISIGISDRYSLFLAPLSVGKHIIEFKVVDHLSGPTSEPIINMVKTIKISDEIHARLSKHGCIGETYEDVIERLLDFYDSKGRQQIQK